MMRRARKVGARVAFPATALFVWTLALILGIAVAARAGPGANDWGRVAELLSTALSLDRERQNFHLLRVPAPAAWNDPERGEWVKIMWADSIPSAGESYLRSSYRLARSYRSFLQNLAVPVDLKPIPELRELWRKYQRTRNTLNRVAGKLYRDEAVVPLDAMALAEALAFSAEPAPGRPFSAAAAVDAALDELERRIADYDQYFREEVPGPFKLAARALIDYENDAYRTVATDPNGRRYSYPAYLVEPELGNWLESCRRGECTSLTLEWSSGKTGGGKDGETRPGELAEFHARFEGYRVFDVFPAPWFSREVVRLYRNGPWRDGPVKENPALLWGESGLLARMPVKLMVVWKPKMTVTFATAGASEASPGGNPPQELTGGGEGPGLGYETGESPEIRLVSRDSREMYSIRSRSDSAYVLGVVSERLP